MHDFRQARMLAEEDQMTVFVEALLQLRFGKERLEDSVNMIRHHTESVQRVCVSVQPVQVLRHLHSRSVIPHPHRASLSFVQDVFKLHEPVALVLLDDLKLLFNSGV